MKKAAFSLGLYLLIFIHLGGSSVCAQLQTELGRSLLEKEPEKPETEPAELILDAHFSNTFNNHIELGLSVDPYTSSLAGEDDPQLTGLINRIGVNLGGDLPVVDKLRFKLQYTPQVENYTGAEGKLDEFDAFSNILLTELSFQPTTSLLEVLVREIESLTGLSFQPMTRLPPVVASYQLQRLVRTSKVYNNMAQQFGFRFGRVLEYNFRIHRFDDDSRREDFLLVGSDTHKMTSRLQFGIFKQMLGKLEYTVEHGSYQTNLNNLILGITGLEENERRKDLRHIGAAKLIQVATERLLFQEEINLFFNRSNVDFFNFASTEVAANSFYRFETGRWLRLRLSRLWVTFEGRQILEELGLVTEDTPNRQDTQIGAKVQLNWQFNQHLTLNADYQITQNRTNETDPLLDFLNYTHTIATLTLRGEY